MGLPHPDDSWYWEQHSDPDQFDPVDLEGMMFGDQLRMPRGIAFFTVGIGNKSYGGPEEGGWWYDTFDGERVFACRPKNKARLQRRLEAWCDRQNKGRPGKSSMACTGVYEVVPGIVDHEPKKTPRYE